MNLRHKIAMVLLFMLSGILGFTLSWYQHKNRVPPIQTIQTFHYPALFVKQLAGDPDAGRKIFNEFCSACHAKEPAIDIHAPRIGDKQAWDARRKLGMTILLQLTIKGVGAMPARGGCFECSDKDLEQAINYLLEQS